MQDKNWLGFFVFMVVVVSISAVSLAYHDVNKTIASCSCLSNECALTGFALEIHNDYCSKLPETSRKSILSYIVVPNVTCSIARDCFYDSKLFGCDDVTNKAIVGWCCYDNCKLFFRFGD